MSYLVPKDIPNCCAHCPYNYSSLICKITKSEIDRDDEYRERLEDCPLIEIKTPHGRLGDLDKLGDRMRGKWTVYDYEALGASPTIIEAED